MASKSKQVKVTLMKSFNRRQAAHKACVLGLGLKKIRQSVVVEDTPCNRGMINKVIYLLNVEEVS
jgi:large subunit ribosomal protein L30